MNYGVFSKFTVEQDEDDAEESLYYLDDDSLRALVQMGRVVLWRAAWLIPWEDYEKLRQALVKVVEANVISKGFNVAGITYYVREVTDEEGVNLNQIPLPNA